MKFYEIFMSGTSCTSTCDCYATNYANREWYSGQQAFTLKTNDWNS